MGRPPRSPGLVVAAGAGKVQRRPHWGQGVQNGMRNWREARRVEFTEDVPPGV